ncbi:MAG: glycosyltransferase [Alphaproteobacteria bacterium]|nr:glycosyltransferase [Alphaproteobacteria bacterium]
MLALICGAIWASLVIYLLCRALRQFRNYQRATLLATSTTNDLPSVSTIVPVRNEIANIGLCLKGLTEQTGPASGSHIIVVDDGSQDGTRAVVGQYIKINPRISLHDAGPLPAGWTGKPHACWRGALLADSDWLCFIDADVRAAPELIGTAVTTAAEQGIDMLSLHPRQDLGSFWERVVIPAGLLVLACAKRFEPTSQDIVNGQFLLIRREAYFAVGGHSQVCAEICEDKALATRLRSQGLRLQVLAAPQLAATRMYRDLHSLWEGFAKNSAEALGSVPATLTAALTTFVFAWTALLLPVATLSVAFAAPSLAAVTGAILAMIGTVIVAGVHFGTARHFRIPVVFGLTFTLGYTAVACLACHGVITQLTGRVTWKGRTYQLTKTSPGRA